MKKTLSVYPSKKELLWGTFYMLLELFGLSYILMYLSSLLSTPLSAEKLNVVFFIVNFGATTLIFRKFINHTLLDAKGRFAAISFAAIRGFLLYWTGNLIVSMLILRLKPDFINVNDATISAMTEENFVPMAICTVFFAPVAEELLFRGILFAGLYKRSRIIAFLVSTAVFSAIHVMGYIGMYPWDTLLLCFVQYIPACISLGWAYAKSGSILSPLLMHIAINAIGVYAMR